MQLTKLRRKKYHVLKDEANCSQIAFERERKIVLYKKLRDQGCSENVAFEALKISRATFYRWRKRYYRKGVLGLEKESRRPFNIREKMWTLEDEIAVYKVRKKYKIWGKQKLAAILEREYNRKLSVSTVGRILSDLIKRGRVRPAYIYTSGKKPYKKRAFTGHAQRWQYGTKAKNPGEYIQMDHTIIDTDCGKQLRSFSAICPVTKIIFEQVYYRATSTTGADFLKQARDFFPFSIRSIQVDGGSEFMKDFESQCKAFNIPLYVLPPKRPQYNGNVERSHATLYYEFFSHYSHIHKLDTLRPLLKEYLNFYNSFRPHQSLKNKTPMFSWENNWRSCL